MKQNMLLKKKMGKRIENIRKEMKLTKEGLAKKLGATGQFIGIVEKGESSLSYDKLEILCDISGYSADFILFGRDRKISAEIKDAVTEFSEEQFDEACEIIKRFAAFIKESDQNI